MKRRNFKIALLLLLVILSGVLYGYYGFLYKQGRDISSETSAYKTSANAIADEYAVNIAAADSKYLNQTLEVKGKVTEIRDSLLLLDTKVVCGFDTKLANIILNKTITVKGRCIGFDELFGEVKLDQCTIKQ